MVGSELLRHYDIFHVKTTTTTFSVVLAMATRLAYTCQCSANQTDREGECVPVLSNSYNLGRGYYRHHIRGNEL